MKNIVPKKDREKRLFCSKKATPQRGGCLEVVANANSGLREVTAIQLGRAVVDAGRIAVNLGALGHVLVVAEGVLTGLAVCHVVKLASEASVGVKLARTQ